MSWNAWQAGQSTTADFSGTWRDDRGDTTVIVQTGDQIHATFPGSSWDPEKGTASNGQLSLFRLTGKLEGDVISWSNGTRWTRSAGANGTAAPQVQQQQQRDPLANADPWDHDGSANARVQQKTRAAQPDAQQSWGHGGQDWSQQGQQAQQAARDDWGGGYGQQNQSAWDQNGGQWAAAASDAPAASAAAETSVWDQWGQAPSDAAPAVTAWGSGAASSTAVAESTDAQKKARMRDFEMWQQYYQQNGTLPGKSEEERQADEERLFTFTGNRAGDDFALYQHAKIDISGPKVERENFPSIAAFEELYTESHWRDKVPAELEHNLKRLGYVRPTPVQQYAIPAGLWGRDIMCCAQTGSGKTAAFLVPTLASMIKHSRATGGLTEPFAGPCKPDTLVLSPTRELCLQIYDDSLRFCHKTAFRVIRCYGQEPAKNQIAEVAKGADVVIATPGRLWDFVTSGIIALDKLNCLVIDEADRMISQGMEDWIRNIVEGNGMPAKENRQTMMFSATFPAEIQQLAKDYLFEHIWICIGVLGGASTTIEQLFVEVGDDDHSKFTELQRVLDSFLDMRTKSDRMLVFTNSKLRAKGLDEQLYDKNFDTGALHGDMGQAEREASLKKFRDGEIDILIATDLASRGLDIDGVTKVVNYDLPREQDVYVQRIGRTGRIGHKGTAITFIATANGDCKDEPEMLKALPNVARQAGHELPAWLQAHVDKIDQGQSWASYQSRQQEARQDVRASSWPDWADASRTH